MKTILSIMAVCLSTAFIYGQQEYQFSNSAFNPYLLNPAAGGLSDVMQFEVGSRMQWMGYTGGPMTIMASGNSQIKIGGGESKVLSEFNVKDEKFFEGPETTIGKSKHVIGGKIWNDAIGPFAKTSFQGSYAYHLPLTKTMNFGVGLGLGMSHFRVDESRVVLYQQDDATYNQFLGNASQQTMGDAQAGFVLYGEKLFFGISGTQLLRNDIQLNDILTQSNLTRHLFVIAKYELEINSDLHVEPLAILKSTGNSPMSVDAGARIISRNATWGGIQYRTGNMLVFQAGTNLIKNLYVNYSYDLSIGKIRAAGSNTHEIQIGYYLGRNRNIDKELKENNKDDSPKL
ncbi:MAG: type IX secretion system membrane protein PorP/SprF [Bacteroidetes bacterium]|nr:MAG: type IX secretion system membrane protein PorP/SprF [Bacteroidota bacterium]